MCPRRLRRRPQRFLQDRSDSAAQSRIRRLCPVINSALPVQTQAVTFDSSKGAQSHTYDGAALSDILTAAVLTGDAEAHNPDLTFAILATGSDGYQATVSFGELSPNFGATPILVAYTEDGQPLDAPRLVVPGDVKGGRYVSDLTDLEVIDLRNN